MARRLAWMNDAACKGEPIATFFPRSRKDVKRAKALCARCPVRQKCAEYASRDVTLVGIWAGKERLAPLV